MDALSMLSNEEENKNDETDNTNNNTDKKNGSEKDHHLRIFLDDISRNTEKRNSSEGNEKVNAKFKQYEGGRLRYPDDRVVAKCCDLLVELIHSVPGRLASSMKPMVAHLLAAIYADCNGRGVMSSVMTLHNSHNQPTQDDPYMDNLDANTDKDKHIGSMYYQKHNSRAENKRKRRKKKTVKRLMNRIGDSHFSIVRKTESKVNRYNKGLAIIDALMNHFEQAQQVRMMMISMMMIT